MIRTALSILFFVAISNNSFAQPSVSITPHFDSDKKSGSIYVQVAGYDTKDFCYSWYGPNDFQSEQPPPLHNLSFGVYHLSLTDCNQVIAKDYGESCKEGSDYVLYSGATIQGTTCEGFGLALNHHPQHVCGLGDSLTIFSSPILPDCMDEPTYDWYDVNHLLESKTDHLKVKRTSEYCVLIKSRDQSTCPCEAFICKDILAVDDNFDIELSLPQSALKWIPDLTNGSDFIWLVVEPRNLSFSITDFNPGITYSGTIYYTDSEEAHSNAPINMIPGSVTSPCEALALTNLGYGRFSIPVNQQLLGSEFEFEIRDTCDNIYTEDILIPKHLTYSKSIRQIDIDLEQSEILFLRTLVRKATSKEHTLVQLTEKGWTLTNYKRIKVKDQLAYELFNKDKNMYFLIIYSTAN